MLSEFSSVAGALAGNLEDLAATAQFEQIEPLLQQLEATVNDLMKQAAGITVETLSR
jgi:hypothetical protein